jgi:hypothetical protein
MKRPAGSRKGRFSTGSPETHCCRTDPDHSGVQIVDRTTVPELNELIGSALSVQNTMDSAYARLNPLGLAPGAIAFDLDPYFSNSLGQELADPTVIGQSH